MKRFVWIYFFIIIMNFSWVALAANNQSVVLGGGLGYHIFSETDETRKGSDAINSYDEIGAAFTSQLFAEWFPFGNFGFGFVSNNQYAVRSYESGSITTDQEWNIRHYFLTINIVPLGGEGYGRLGIFLGAGPSVYTINEKREGSSNDYDISKSTTGTATTLGIYGDWGGEAFGMRVGYQFIATDYPDLEFSKTNKYKVSASGSSAYFALRWAF